MPQRKSVRTVESEEVQGSDSWIKISSPKMEDMKAYRAVLLPIQERIERLQTEGVKESDSRILSAREELNLQGQSLISSHVLEWNWVDDNGKPLPQPSEKGAIEKLTLGEVNWIMRQFDFGEKEKKA